MRRHAASYTPNSTARPESVNEKRKMSQNVLGVIGGSGFYQMKGLDKVELMELETPFGQPSDPFYQGRIGEIEVVFLARHGRGHRILPSEINFRANVFGMKQLGVTHLVSVSTAGSLKEEIHPGELVVPNQFIDRTFKRPETFFGDGLVVHVSLADPVCANLASDLAMRRTARRRDDSRWRDVSVHGGSAILDARRVESLPQLGRERYQHDGDAGSAARARSGDVLRGAGAGDRL